MQKIFGREILPNIFYGMIIMFSDYKLSAKRALSGEELAVMPLQLLLMTEFLFFSLCNAGLTLIPFPVPKTVLSAAAFISAPLSVFCISPLRLKMQKRYILLYSGSRSSDKIDFESGINACILNFILFAIKAFLFAAYEALPISATAFLLHKLRTDNMSERTAKALAIGIIAGLIIGLIAFLIQIQKYSRAEFYLAAYRGITPFEALKLSIKHTDGKLLKTLLFKFGFAFRFALCIFGLPILFVIPFYRQSLTAFFIEY